MLLRLALVALLAGVAAVSSAPAKAQIRAAQLALSTTPGLMPAFSPERQNYVIRCDGEPLTLSGTVPPRTRLIIDGTAYRPGAFTASISLKPGQGVTARLFFLGTIFPDSISTIDYRLRCLPTDFPVWTLEGGGEGTSEWFIASPSLGVNPSPYVIIFDRFGTPVWWFKNSYPAINATALPDGTVTWMNYHGGSFGTDTTEKYNIRRLDGRVVASIGASDGTATGTHEFQRTVDGGYAFLAYVRRAPVDLGSIGVDSDTVYDCRVTLTDENGKPTWVWNASDHIPFTEFQSVASKFASRDDGFDLYHCNSVDVTKTSVLVSFRHLNAIYMIDRATGNIIWKLGGTQRPESLRVVNDTRTLDGQHDARILPDGTITVHDNGTFGSGPPRAVRYKIDLTERTATVIDQLSDPTVPYSTCCGSARMTPSGGWLVNWGGVPMIAEYDRAGNAIFRLRFAAFSYRATPVPYGVFSADALWGGMEAMNPRD